MSARDDAVKQAGDVRREARELRRATVRLRRDSRRRRHECLLNYARTSRILAEPVGSPWSDLLWRRPASELDQVLVSVP